MNEKNVIKREKFVYQLNNKDEFVEGKWLNNIKKFDNDLLVEVSYRSNNNILIINTMRAKTLKEYLEDK
jgi:hypothetical protein